MGPTLLPQPTRDTTDAVVRENCAGAGGDRNLTRFGHSRAGYAPYSTGRALELDERERRRRDQFA